jgi:biotin carboxyl carrier protein
MRNAEFQWKRLPASDLPLPFRIPHSAFRIQGGAVKYFVTIGAQTVEVEVDGERVLVGGEAVDAHLAPLAGTPLYHLLLGGASWTVAAQPLEDDGRWAMGVVGERVEVAVRDEQSRETEAAAAPGGAGPAVVRAPMPGLVVRVEVAAGQRVEAGAGLVVVEAMKMENELRAPRAGVVQTVHVAAGQAVEKGVALVTLASPEPSG